jgi:membrane-associated phospholipid phosphatase
LAPSGSYLKTLIDIPTHSRRIIDIVQMSNLGVERRFPFLKFVRVVAISAGAICAPQFAAAQASGSSPFPDPADLSFSGSVAIDAASIPWQWPPAAPGLESARFPRSQDLAANSAPQTLSPESSQSSAQDRRDPVFYPGDTEKIKPLARKLLLNILLDQKEIFTSPFHMDRQSAKWWLFSAAATAALIVEDRRISDSFENSHGQVVWGGRISQIGASYTLVPLVVGYYGFGVWKDHAKAREIGVLGTESLLDSLIVAGVLKEVTRRNRPDEKNPGDFWGGGTSFPSGHAIQVWSIASLVAHEYHHQPVVSIVAYSLAGVVSVSRVAAQRHFASDIFVGGTMGWFIGRYVYNTHMSHLAHKHSSLIPVVVPQFQVEQSHGNQLQADRRSYGVMVLFASR